MCHRRLHAATAALQSNRLRKLALCIQPLSAVFLRLCAEGPRRLAKHYSVFPFDQKLRQVVVNTIHRPQWAAAAVLPQLEKMLGKVFLFLLGRDGDELPSFNKKDSARPDHGHDVIAQPLGQVLRDHRHVKEIAESRSLRKFLQRGRGEEHHLGVGHREGRVFLLLPAVLRSLGHLRRNIGLGK